MLEFYCLSGMSKLLCTSIAAQTRALGLVIVITSGSYDQH